MAEKRRQKRVSPQELETIEVQIMGQGFMDILHAKDISQNGIGIYVPPHYSSAQAKNKVTLIITVPGFKSFEAGGIISHTGMRVHDRNRKCFGIQFTDLSDHHKKILASYVTQRLADNRKHIRVEPTFLEPLSAEAMTSKYHEKLAIKDISLGGALAINPLIVKMCSPEEDIELLIATPEGEKIRVKAAIRHSDQSSGSFGLCFKDLSDEQISILKRYIMHRVVQKQMGMDTLR